MANHLHSDYQLKKYKFEEMDTYNYKCIPTIIQVVIHSLKLRYSYNNSTIIRVFILRYTYNYKYLILYKGQRH